MLQHSIAVAIHSYTAQTRHDLTVKSGDFVQIVDDGYPPFHMCQLGDAVGNVPRAYLVVVRPAIGAALARLDSLNDGFLID